MRLLAIITALLMSISTEAQVTVETTPETSYITNGRHTSVVRYHANGQVRERGQYFGEVPDGKWETFDEKGVKTAEINYLRGVRNGELRVWDTNSGTYTEVAYSNGTMVSSNRYVRDTGFASSEK